jgi:Rrf2 family nitric oxide-sensitive transcriptional repressor
MQLTRYTDYSLRVLIYLATQEGAGGPDAALVTASDIAKRFDIARNHLIKVVHRLGQLGYIETIRGKGGGIRLGRDSADIRIGAVVRDMEANLELIDCNTPPCPLNCGCRLKGILGQAAAAFLEVLDRYTLADITDNPQQLRQLLFSTG